MKRLLAAGAIAALTMISGAVYAFDPVAEAEASSAAIDKAYTLYVEQPKEEIYKTAFDGWVKEKEYSGAQFTWMTFSRTLSPDEEAGYGCKVKQTVLIGINKKDGTVDQYFISFKTNNKRQAQRLYDEMSERLMKFLMGTEKQHKVMMNGSTKDIWLLDKGRRSVELGLNVNAPMRGEYPYEASVFRGIVHKK